MTKDVGDSNAVDAWLDIGEAALDERFGKGFAKANPTLLGAYVQACAIEAVRTALIDEIGGALEGIQAAVADVREAIAGHE